MLILPVVAGSVVEMELVSCVAEHARSSGN